jgi:hypothetical protein
MSCRLTAPHHVLGRARSTTTSAAKFVVRREFWFEVSTADLRFTKKQQSGSTNAGAIGDHVMVHCTDVAGRVGCSMGQAKPGDDGICCHAPNGALLEKSHLPKISASSYFDGKKCSHLLMAAVPSVHAVYVETLGSMKY